jgi:holo-[acyl-carrier protein] synthase
MNILGLGFDATDIPRIGAAFERYGERFLHRVFTEGEIAYCTRRRNPVPHLAGRFAAKEAAMKALGTGHSRGVLWRDIEVFRAYGPPQLRLHGGAAAQAARMRVQSTLVTITHSDALAMAQVLLLG